MRLIYFGTSEFAVPTLAALAPHVILVVSQPDRPSGRGLAPRSSPVKQAAAKLSLPIETPAGAKSPEFIERISGLRADALLVAAYGRILPEALLGAQSTSSPLKGEGRVGVTGRCGSATTRGGINLHASILPKYRGAAPIQHAILEGETETGVTLMQMDKGMDTGDIIAIETTPIGEHETAGELEARLAEVAAAMAAEWMPRIVTGNYPRTPQDHDRATSAPKMEPAGGEIRFEMSAEQAYRYFRACTPKPGAFLLTRFGAIKLLKAGLDRTIEGTPSPLKGEGRVGVSGASARREGEPGTVLFAAAGRLAVGFQKGALQIHLARLPGRKAVSGSDLANGLRLKPGDRLD